MTKLSKQVFDKNFRLFALHSNNSMLIMKDKNDEFLKNSKGVYITVSDYFFDISHLTDPDSFINGETYKKVDD